ncbi:hypothetical protein [Mesorhizobium sp. 2RAF21]|uniref:hypothetical protein n=1 Tax=Mesorhizobium sp. 2RAF21 TaxID=3232995 RepID=UPI003F9D2DF8
MDFLQRCLGLPLLKKEGQAHAEKDLTVRVIHTGQFCGRAPRLNNLVQFEFNNRVGEDQRICAALLAPEH